MRLHPKFDPGLRHLVKEGWLDEAIAEWLNGSKHHDVYDCTARDVYRRRVKLGLLATSCKRIPWQDALDRKAVEANRLRELIIE